MCTNKRNMLRDCNRLWGLWIPICANSETYEYLAVPLLPPCKTFRSKRKTCSRSRFLNWLRSLIILGLTIWNSNCGRRDSEWFLKTFQTSYWDAKWRLTYRHYSHKRRVDDRVRKNDGQKRDVVLGYFSTSILSSWKPIISALKRPENGCGTLKEIFISVSEASIYAQLLQLLSLTLKEGECIVEYLSPILTSVSRLENAEQIVLEIEQKQAILRYLTEDCVVAAESIMSMKHIYSEAVSNLIVRETELWNMDNFSTLAVATRTHAIKQSQNCFNFKNQGHFAHNCWVKKDERKKV